MKKLKMMTALAAFALLCLSLPVYSTSEISDTEKFSKTYYAKLHSQGPSTIAFNVCNMDQYLLLDRSGFYPAFGATYKLTIREVLLNVRGPSIR
ncbi:hypothetical protein AB9P05_11875 [Roseivirga sp. BDSF3-8]|uniref:hypothetical protein n=1 Tax=Roseivirga sp. BDSF3-8 TaxID=3241598 RepID=UPI003531FF8F